MSREPLYVCMTMDVERIRSLGPMGGPDTWELGEEAVRSYCHALSEQGLRATLFVVPDTATKQGGMLQEVAGQTGAELGMHFHPQYWRDNYRSPDDHEFLGGYSGEEQYELLSEALSQTTEGLGQQPRAFRGGNFSANDETFGVLVRLGFTHGSVGQPGRTVTGVRAVWPGACPDVHRAHRAFRLVPGDLDFVEVPVTSDRARTDNWTGVGDVRFEGATPEQIAKAVRQEVTRQVEDGELIKHVCLFTHNVVSYFPESRIGESKYEVLVGAIEHIREIAEELDLEVRGATIAEVRDALIEAEREVARPGGN